MSAYTHTPVHLTVSGYQVSARGCFFPPKVVVWPIPRWRWVTEGGTPKAPTWRPHWKWVFINTSLPCITPSLNLYQCTVGGYACKVVYLLTLSRSWAYLLGKIWKQNICHAISLHKNIQTIVWSGSSWWYNDTSIWQQNLEILERGLLHMHCRVMSL